MTDPRFYPIIDLEATTSDDGSLPPEQMETIEIGAVVVDAATLEPVDEYQSASFVFCPPTPASRLHCCPRFAFNRDLQVGA